MWKSGPDTESSRSKRVRTGGQEGSEKGHTTKDAPCSHTVKVTDLNFMASMAVEDSRPKRGWAPARAAIMAFRKLDSAV